MTPQQFRRTIQLTYDNRAPSHPYPQDLRSNYDRDLHNLVVTKTKTTSEDHVNLTLPTKNLKLRYLQQSQ